MNRAAMIPPETRARIAQDRRGGATYEQLQLRYHCCTQSLAAIFHEYGLVHVRRVQVKHAGNEDDRGENVENGPYGLYLRYLPG